MPIVFCAHHTKGRASPLRPSHFRSLQHALVRKQYPFTDNLAQKEFPSTVSPLEIRIQNLLQYSQVPLDTDTRFSIQVCLTCCNLLSEVKMTKLYLVCFVFLHYTAATRFPYDGLSLPPFLPYGMQPLGIPPFARLPMLIPQRVLPTRRLLTRPVLLPRQRIILNGPQRISQLR